MAQHQDRLPKRLRPVISGVLALPMLFGSCSPDARMAVPAANLPDLTVEAPGPFPSGNATFSVSDPTRGRNLLVEVWYPAQAVSADAAAAGEPVSAMVPPGPDRDTYTALLNAAPAGTGPTRQTHSARDAPPAETADPWPLILFSHCMNCTRFDTLSVAERLAGHGFVVAAPDHTGGTLFDAERGNAAAIDNAFLETRAEDMIFLLDQLLAGSDAVPAAVGSRIDADRIGIYGHSFGGSTVGRVLDLDKRFKAGLALAVPMASPLLSAVDLPSIDVPIFFLLAQEDNMIFEIGNSYIRDNFDQADVPVWLAEVKDAGHMSFTDLCKITTGHHAGCGTGNRQTGDHEPFTYIDQRTGIAIAAAYTTAFFKAQLNDDAGAAAYLTIARPAEWLTIRYREGHGS